MNYSIANFVTSLKNASLANRKKVAVQFSKLSFAVAQLLEQRGFVRDVKEEIVDGKKKLLVTLEYEGKNPVITGVAVVSKPSLRVYTGAKDAMKKHRRSLGFTVLSTNQGIMVTTEAKKKGIGGEVLFTIW